MDDIDIGSARLAALEAVFLESIVGFYALVPDGKELLRRSLRHIAEDAIPPIGVERQAFQIALAKLLARMDERLHPE